MKEKIDKIMNFLGYKKLEGGWYEYASNCINITHLIKIIKVYEAINITEDKNEKNKT